MSCSLHLRQDWRVVLLLCVTNLSSAACVLGLLGMQSHAADSLSRRPYATAVQALTAAHGLTRRYLPTLTWHNERKQRRGTFHLPEHELRAFATAARHAFGSLEGLHAALAIAEVPSPGRHCSKHIQVNRHACTLAQCGAASPQVLESISNDLDSLPSLLPMVIKSLSESAALPYLTRGVLRVAGRGRRATTGANQAPGTAEEG